jgi:hypothetical protein
MKHFYQPSRLYMSALSPILTVVILLTPFGVSANAGSVCTTIANLPEVGTINCLGVVQIRQESNLCVPTSVAMVLAFYGDPTSPRLLKELSLGRRYDPSQPFNDFTSTSFAAMTSGLKKLGLNWKIKNYSNDEKGFQTGISDIEHEIDIGHPVLVDTDLFSGHTFVVISYSRDAHLLFAIDPNIAAPGLREISFEDFANMWNSSKDNYNLRASVLTAPPR